MTHREPASRYRNFILALNLPSLSHTRSCQSEFANWNDGEPNDWGGNERCTTVQLPGGWNDVDCTARAPCICDAVGDEAETAGGIDLVWLNEELGVCSNSGGCSDCLTEESCLGKSCLWEGGVCSGCSLGVCTECVAEEECVENGCSWGESGCEDPLIAPDAMTFLECARYCSDEVEGARIPCIRSEEENANLRLRNRGELPWIGVAMLETGLGWIDATCDSTYENWSPGEPSGGDERCVQWWTSGKWNDIDCKSLLSCVCQRTDEPAVIDWEALVLYAS